MNDQSVGEKPLEIFHSEEKNREISSVYYDLISILIWMISLLRGQLRIEKDIYVLNFNVVYSAEDGLINLLLVICKLSIDKVIEIDILIDISYIYWN